MARSDSREVFLFWPDLTATDQGLIIQAPNLGQMILLGEETSQADHGSTLAYLGLEVVDQRPHLVDELPFAFSKGHLLVLDVVDLALVLLNELQVALPEDGEGAKFFVVVFGLIVFTINLRWHESFLNILQLLLELAVHVLNSMSFLLKASWGGQDCKLLLLDFKGELVTDPAELLLEVHVVVCGLLGLISQQGQLSREK